jgi:uncharacterized protein DUF5658
MSLRTRGAGRRISWFLALVLLMLPVRAFAQDIPGGAQNHRALVPLYVSFAALQALDVHSTMRALDGGAVEGNPLMRGVAHQPAALIGVKAAGAASTIWLAHRMSKRSKAGAFVVMAAVNSAYAMVVAHNYRAGR